MYHETINGIWTGTVHGGYGPNGMHGWICNSNHCSSWDADRADREGRG